MSLHSQVGRQVKLEIKIPRAYTRGVEKPLTFYVLEVRMTVGGEVIEWTTDKRFSDFDGLHKELKKKVSSLPALPSKTLVRSVDAAFIESRRQSLAALMVRVLQEPVLFNSDELHQWLGVESHLPADSGAGGVSAETVAVPQLRCEIHESLFGVPDLTYLPQHGILIEALADLSLPSRLDSYITNLRMPWEKEGQDGVLVPVGGVAIWRQQQDCGNFEKLWSENFPYQATCVSWQESEEALTVGLDNGTVTVFRVPLDGNFYHHTEVCTVLSHSARVVGADVDPLTQRVVSVGKDRRLKIVSLDQREITAELTLGTPVSAFLSDFENRRIFLGTEAGPILVYEIGQQTPRLLTTLAGHTGQVRGLHLDANKETLFSCAFDGSVRVWKIGKQGKEKYALQTASLKHTKKKLRMVCWCPSSREIVAGDDEGFVGIWDVRSGNITYMLSAHNAPITRLVWVDSDRRLITAAKDKTIKVWDFPRRPTSSLADSSDLLADLGRLRAPSTDQSSVPAAPLQSNPTRTLVKPTSEVGYNQYLLRPDDDRDNDHDDDLLGWNR